MTGLPYGSPVLADDEKSPKTPEVTRSSGAPPPSSALTLEAYEPMKANSQGSGEQEQLSLEKPPRSDYLEFPLILVETALGAALAPRRDCQRSP